MSTAAPSLSVRERSIDASYAAPAQKSKKCKVDPYHQIFSRVLQDIRQIEAQDAERSLSTSALSENTELALELEESCLLFSRIFETEDGEGASLNNRVQELIQGTIASENLEQMDQQGAEKSAADLMQSFMFPHEIFEETDTEDKPLHDLMQSFMFPYEIFEETDSPDPQYCPKEQTRIKPSPDRMTLTRELPLSLAQRLPCFSHEIVQKKSNLQSYFREHVWPKTPTEEELYITKWPNMQIRVIQIGMVLLLKREQTVIECRQTPGIDIATILQKMRKLSLEPGEVEYLNAEEEEDLDEAESLFLSTWEKLKDPQTPSALLDRLEVLNREKRLQIKRSHVFLKKVIKEKKKRSLKNKEEALASEQKEAAAAAAQRAQELQFRLDLETSMNIAKDLLWSVFSDAEKKRLASEISQTSINNFRYTEHEFTAFAYQCAPIFLERYLETLKAHPQYDSLLSRFPNEIQNNVVVNRIH